jgi:4-amino-4-deoxy-L-arabinose transferase-like glycosyltransferase
MAVDLAVLGAVGWQRAALCAVLLLSAALNLIGLDREGYANQYYAAAVLSMLQSWHTFFFASFDPGGFVSVDKPPLGFWIQAASAKLLGFSGWSLLLPEALAGVISVGLLYHLVRRAFGPTAGLLAALMLALTPISVVTSRNNTIDSLLVLTVLLAAWAALRATERGALRWLLAAAALLGLAFEIKMLQAYLVAPAIFLLYLAAAPKARLTRIGHLTLAGLTLIVVSLAWPLAVDLTPPDQRPYVGSAQDNSALNLALGYNGLERLLGRGWANEQRDEGAAEPAGGGRFRPAGGAAASNNPGSIGPADDGAGQGGPQLSGDGGAGGFGGGPGGFGENGLPGPLRLLNQQLAGQISWLLPLALVGLGLSGWRAWTGRHNLARSRPAQAFLLWGTWLATTAVFFSVAEYWHRYYLVMMGPPLAALSAVGVWGAWRSYRRRRWPGWLLPLALLGTAALQVEILTDYPEWAARLNPIVLGLAALSAALLLAIRLAARRLPGRALLPQVSALAATLGLVALLAGPAAWSGLPAVTGQNGGGLPAAGPPTRGGPGGGGPDGFPGRDGETGLRGPGFGERAVSQATIDFLTAQRGSSDFLVATTNANAAAPIILATGQPVMALGGFLGSDPILAVDQLSASVASGRVRFFLLGGFGPPGSSGLSSWVRTSCQPVTPSESVTEREQLYDCAASAGGGG